MQSANPERVVHAELYVRTELPRPARKQVTTIEKRLDDLVDTDALGSLGRTDWPKRVPVEGCAPQVRDTYLAFRAWADENEVRLTPFFETRECYSADHGGMTDWLVVPAMCLAIYEEGDLEAVYPHADGATTRTVEDGLHHLRHEVLDVAGPSTVTAD